MTNEVLITKSESAPEDEDAFWLDGEPSIIREEPERSVYDLEERTARFGETVIDFAKTIPLGPVNNRIIGQLVGAGTSVGAKICEGENRANDQSEGTNVSSFVLRHSFVIRH